MAPPELPRAQSIEEKREIRADEYAAKRACEAARARLDRLEDEALKRRLLGKTAKERWGKLSALKFMTAVRAANVEEDLLASAGPPEAMDAAPYLAIIEAQTKTHITAIARERHRHSLDTDPEARARASLDRASRDSVKRRKKPRIAKDVALDVRARLLEDGSGVFAFWGVDTAWPATWDLDACLAEALAPTPPAPTSPSPEKLWSAGAADLGGYAPAAPFAPFADLKTVGPWRPPSPPRPPPNPLQRVANEASCSQAAFIKTVQRAWLTECWRVRDARWARRASECAVREAVAKKARRPDAATVPALDVEDMLEAWARSGWRAPASARTALPAALEKLDSRLAATPVRDLEELLEVVLEGNAGHLDVERDQEWREDWAWEPWPARPKPKTAWATRFLGTERHDENKWHATRRDYASVLMARMHRTMRRREGNARSWIFEAPAAYDVVVTIHAASDLPSLDGARGVSDPYCVVQLDAKVQRTDYVKDDLNPNFGGRTFFFNNTRSTFVEVRLMDKDWNQDDEALGTVRVPLLGLGAPPRVLKVELSTVRDAVPGSVTLSWHRTPVAKACDDDDEADVIDLAHYGHTVDTSHEARRGAVALAVGAAAKGRRPTLVSVRECGLEDRGLTDVVDVLKDLDRSRLGSLDLSQNWGGSLCMTRLADLLRADALPALRVLDVSSCKLGRSIMPLLAALGGCGSIEDGVDKAAYPLQRLAVARNTLGDAEGAMLAGCVARNPHLRRVDAAWNGFTQTTGALLVAALNASSSKLEALVVDEACVPRGAPSGSAAAAVRATKPARRRRAHLDRDIYAPPFPAPRRPLLVGDAFRVQARDGLAVVVRA